MKGFSAYIRELYRFSKLKFINNLLFMLLAGLTSGIGILLLVPLLSATGITGRSTIDIPVLNGVLDLLKQLSYSFQLIIILLDIPAAYPVSNAYKQKAFHTQF